VGGTGEGSEGRHAGVTMRWGLGAVAYKWQGEVWQLLCSTLLWVVACLWLTALHLALCHVRLACLWCCCSSWQQPAAAAAAATTAAAAAVAAAPVAPAAADTAAAAAVCPPVTHPPGRTHTVCRACCPTPPQHPPRTGSGLQQQQQHTPSTLTHPSDTWHWCGAHSAGGW
jgi:hypothetical protein